MIRFKYCGTHIKDEEYMNKMSANGWNTKSLTEGFWIFEKGKENEYTYRIYYFRGMNKKAVHNKIKELEKEDIEFVCKYSFWGIFRAKKDFELYNKEEQLEVCNKIRKPMIIAIVVCPLLIAICISLSFTNIAWYLLWQPLAIAICISLSIIISKIFVLIACLISVYYFVCLYLTIEYTKLINSIKRNKNNE